jgi:2-polyprenyl-3-methyl-5-hydroxy-6-metoxy-1,4-benzoquinol methylase
VPASAESTQKRPTFDETARFEFGTNWLRFIDKVSDRRIRAAEESVRAMLGEESLEGIRFLDVGCGSGLFSLAAHRMRADVHSFDFDSNSVAATEALRERFAGAPTNWTVEQGSVLDGAYLASLGSFHVVYSWGVLHHTGAMWEALANATTLVRPGGLLAISLYNDQGRTSARWLHVKRAYNRAGALGRATLVACSAIALYWRPALSSMLHSTDCRLVTREVRERERGMSRWHDLVDWVGGYPFEVSRPEQVFHFVSRRNFELQFLKTCAGGIGCNEYVFRRRDAAGGAGNSLGT